MTDGEFLEYVQGGGQVETGDWMPDEYRARLIKFIEMHGSSELMGVLPERDWISTASSSTNAIHRASGDHAGRKSPPIPVSFVVVVTAFARRDCTSIVQMRA